ncbi:protein of unknown function [Methylorubrum extorquens]|uniref:Uncharacterized protein n=1 Tax=Methylorubrum extorquens TaxID=408 RepID=A0A2N9ALJ0_METEX|nr:protein of unknown function [Methylorubrum extorquens]
MLMVKAPRVLVDARETDLLRGFHALAVTECLLRAGMKADWHFLTEGDPDEQLAIASLRFDWSIAVSSWDGRTATEDFDLYVIVGDAFPADPTTEAALQAARLTLAGLTSASELPVRPAVLCMLGHDTAALAGMAATLLRAEHITSGSSLGWRR